MMLQRTAARALVAWTAAVLAAGCATAAPANRAAVAGPMPPRSLVIVGGGPRTEEMMRRFVELAGGPRARIAVDGTIG